MDEELFSDYMHPDGFHLKNWVKQGKPHKDDTLTANYFEIFSTHTLLSGMVFQDGIRIPVHAASIAPIGVCRARVNLTAQSRLVLNASRNAIDESPSLLEQWVSDAGTYIQQHIFNRVTEVFEKSGVHWEKKDFLIDDDGLSNQLLRQSLKGLRKITQAHGRKI